MSDQLAQLGYGIDTSEAKRGEQELLRIFDTIESRFERAVSKMESLDQRFQKAVGLSGRANQASLADKQQLEAARLERLQAQQATNAERHAQRLQQIETQKGARLSTIQAKEATDTTRAAQRLEQLEASKEARLTILRTQAVSNAERSAKRLQEIEAQKTARLSALQTQRENAEARHQQRLTELATRSQGSLSSAANAATTLGNTLTTAVTVPLAALAGLAAKSAVELDRNQKALTALEGGAAQAKTRLQELNTVADKTPGLTRKTVQELFGALRPIEQLNPATIEKFAASYGKLNAVFDLGSARGFAQNLTQLFTQSFERGDLKEALGRVPIFSQLLEKAFGTANTETLRKMKESGKLTIASFFDGIAQAIQSDPRLAGIEEALGSRLEKATERASSALAPLGAQILESTLPSLERLAPQIESLIASFNRLSPTTKDNLLLLGGLSLAAGPALTGIGNLTKAATGLVGVLGAVGQTGTLLGALATVNPVVLGIGGVLIAGAALWYQYGDAVQNVADTIAAAQRQARGGVANPAFLTDANGQPFILDKDKATSVDLSGLAGDKYKGLLGPQVGVTFTPTGAIDFGNSVDPTTRQLTVTPTDKTPKGKGARAVDEITRLNQEIALFRNTSNQAFQLKIQTADLQATRATLEDLLKLRRELALPLAGAFTNADGKLKELTQLRGEAGQLAALKEARKLAAEIAAGQVPLAGFPEAVRDALREVTNFKLPTLVAPRNPQQDLLERTTVQRRVNVPLFGANVSLPVGEGFDRRSLLNTQLRNGEDAIQARIAQGLLSEREGRKEILSLQNRFKGALLETLAAERELARQRGQLDLQAQLEGEIQATERLGQALDKRQRFLRGLGEGADAGDLFEQFGNGLSETIGRGFRNGFKDVKQSFTALLQDLASEFLRSQLLSVVRRLFQPAPAATSGNLTTSFAKPSLAGAGGLGSLSNFTTPSFNGSPIPGLGGQASSTGGSTGSASGFNLGGFNLTGLRNNLSKLPLIGGLFARSGSAAIPAATGPLSTITAAQAGISTQLSTETALAKAAGVGSVSTLASLGASGLLAGGGILGGLAGGNSQLGRLAGSVGGTLGLGALGAAGVFGSGIQAALPALFSNPITAVVAAGLIGGALLFNYLGGRDYRKFQKAVRDEYALKVDGKEGKGVYEQVKSLGEQVYGKGKFSKNLLETIRLEDARKLLASYAEQSGQADNPLVQRYRRIEELQNPFDVRNRVTIRRATGGSFGPNQNIIVGDGGRPEVVSFNQGGYVYPSVNAFAQSVLPSVSARGNANAGAPSNTNANAEAQEVKASVSALAQTTAFLARAVAELNENVARLTAAPPDAVIMKGLEKAKNGLAQAIGDLVDNNTSGLRGNLARNLNS